ncbi:MAG: response regulator, partial [Pirellulaceae bacterium]|nr:response regulator [Pirellulaceae bacterium]
NLVASAIVVAAIWKEQLIQRSARREADAGKRADLQQRRFETICESTYDAIFEADSGGCITWASGQLITKLGYSHHQVLGRRQLHFVAPHRRRTLISETGASDSKDVEYCVETQILDSRGRARWVRLSGGTFTDAKGVVKWVSAIRDIDVEMANIERMFERSRLESLGTVCGGLAHDFNNLLTVIGIYGELVQEPEIREGILQSQRQAADVTAGLLTFARKQEFRDQLINVQEFICAAKGMIERLVPANVDCRWKIRCPEASVNVDPSQLQQVLINLVNNANHAMSAGGSLVISAEIKTLSRTESAVHGLDAGDYVSLQVIDTGCGMKPETTIRAIEPFFTTKPRGQGTGLGLATAHGVATRAHGTLIITSEWRVGTAIEVLLPKQLSIVESSSTELPTSGAETLDGIVNRRILLIDDRESLAEALERSLRRVGARVTTRGTAEEAWDEVRENSAFDLIITDIALPGESGIELIQRVRSRHPEMKAILISGHQQDDLSVVTKHPEITRFLPKPFGVNDLLAAARQLLAFEPAVH